MRFAVSSSALTVPLLSGLLALVAAGCGQLQADLEVMDQKVESALQPEEGPPKGTVVLQPLAPVRRDVFTRSYRVGDQYSVHTGGTVVSIKNYSITERVGKATALRDFGQVCKSRLIHRGRLELCQDAPLSSVRGAMGSVFDVVAGATFPDGQYFAVAVPSDASTQVYLLVDPSGRLRKGGYVAWRDQLNPGTTLGRVPVVELAPDVALDSQAPLFSFETVEKFVHMGPGYLSFDLVFTGTRETARGEHMTFDYREYMRDSTDAPTFESTLEFPTTEPTIEVGKLRIAVEPDGYDGLRFRVVADAQPIPAGAVQTAPEPALPAAPAR